MGAGGVSSAAIRERVRRSDFAGALELACPFLRGRIPAALAVLYGFVGEEDLLDSNPRRPDFRPLETRRALATLRLMPAGPDRSLLEAYVLLCADRLEQSARLTRGVEAARPGDPNAALLLAVALWLRGDRERTRRFLPEALRAVERAVVRGGATRDALLLRAQIRFEFEDNVGGLRDLDAVLALHPLDLDTRVGRADILGDLKRFPSALRESERVLRSRPGVWWALAQRGRLLGLQGATAKALDDLDSAVARWQGSGALYSWRAEVLRKAGRYRDAMADLGRAVALSPGYAFAWECRGRLHLTLGDPAAAVRDLDEACRRDPVRTFAFVWRGEAHLKLGRLEAAACDFDLAAPLDPRTTWNPVLADGETAGQAARAAAFWSDLDRSVRLAPADPAGWFLRGRFRASVGLEREGLADLTRAIELARAADDRRREGAALAWRGRALLRLGAPRRALGDLTAAVALAPRCDLFRAWKADALLAVGAEPEALTEYDRALRRPARGLAPAFLARARIRTRARLWGLARSDYETAFLLDTKSKTARRGLAHSERKLQQERG